MLHLYVIVYTVYMCESRSKQVSINADNIVEAQW